MLRIVDSMMRVSWPDRSPFAGALPDARERMKGDISSPRARFAVFNCSLSDGLSRRLRWKGSPMARAKLPTTQQTALVMTRRARADLDDGFMAVARLGSIPNGGLASWSAAELIRLEQERDQLCVAAAADGITPRRTARRRKKSTRSRLGRSSHCSNGSKVIAAQGGFGGSEPVQSRPHDRSFGFLSDGRQTTIHVASAAHLPSLVEQKPHVGTPESVARETNTVPKCPE
jgi:hypothetical protein